MLKESWKKILLGALLLTGLTMLLGSDSSDKKADSLLAMPKAEAALRLYYSLGQRQKPLLCLPTSRNI